MTTEYLFWSLGVHMGSIGCRRSIEAVEWVLENEDRLAYLVAYVYVPIASQYGCTWKAVERNLRTVIRRAWKQNPDLMDQLAGYPLKKPPKAGEFLDMVFTFLTRQKMKV